MRALRAPPIRLTLEPLQVDIDFHGCADAAAGFSSVLRGWGQRPSTRSTTAPADVRIVRSGNHYRWHGRRLTKPLVWRQYAPTTTMGVICDLHDVLFDWFLGGNRGHLCLHAAAIEVGSELVLIPSVGKAGKSTLSVVMAQLGHRVFADDVLALEPGCDRGMAFGVVPRLRRPLPRGIGQSYRRFLGSRSGPANENWIYANLRAGEIAPFGETSPIKAIVFLDRGSRGPARLEPVDSAYVMQELIQQNFADGVAPTAAFDRLLALASSADCRRLVFSDTNEAARLLSTTYSGSRKRRASCGADVSTAPGVERRLGDAVFLVSQRQDAVLGLSPSAAAIWQQLSQGRSRQMIEALFRSAFPEVAIDRIRADIDHVLGLLRRHGLIRPNGSMVAVGRRRKSTSQRSLSPRAPRQSSARR
ncbi:MAG: PqqD family peptide modification chaperone [Hyphomicrobiaceae bacterium]